MPRGASLLLAGALTFLPLLESFDTWEHPWDGDGRSDEIVFTLLSCALAVGCASLRGLFRSRRFVVAPSGAVSPGLLIRRPLASASWRAVPLTSPPSGLSPPPFRI